MKLTQRAIAIAIIMCGSCSFASTVQNGNLNESWSEFVSGIETAQENITDEGLFPAQPSDRELAEGYRYLLAHLGRMIEMEMRMDPEFPEFYRSVDMLRKWTGENPDTMYLKAPVNASSFYKVTGKAMNTEEWRSSGRVPGPKAPRIVIFQTITNVPGDTGTLSEMRECRSQTLDSIRSFDFEVDDSGVFEILLGPERPEGYTASFLQTRKSITCQATNTTREVEANFLSVREVFSDWEDEIPLELSIIRIDKTGKGRKPIDADFMSRKLSKIARELPNQIRFWQLLQEQALEIAGDRNGDGIMTLPLNGINPPALPSDGVAGGVAGAGQLYAGGVYELPEEHVLLVKTTAPVEPHYIGFQLNNRWFEGPDQQNYVSSLTGAQLPVASDGTRYFIIAKEDPGVPGWVDTTGYDFGSFVIRYSFREVPQESLIPSAEAMLVHVNELRKILPPDIGKVTQKQREREVAVRQEAIKRRWRNY